MVEKQKTTSLPLWSFFMRFFIFHLLSPGDFHPFNFTSPRVNDFIEKWQLNKAFFNINSYLGVEKISFK